MCFERCVEQSGSDYYTLYGDVDGPGVVVVLHMVIAGARLFVREVWTPLLSTST